MSRLNKTVKVIGATVGAALFLYVVYVASKPATRAPQESPRPSPSDAGASASPDTPGLTYEAVRVPKITLPEFSAPHFISATPRHEDVVMMRDTKEVVVRFDAPLEAASKIFVFSTKKAVASRTEISQDKRSLRAFLPTGDFELARIPRGQYDVYYTACFPGEGCFNGQYAFMGL